MSESGSARYCTSVLSPPLKVTETGKPGTNVPVAELFEFRLREIDVGGNVITASGYLRSWSRMSADTSDDLALATRAWRAV